MNAKPHHTLKAANMQLGGLIHLSGGLTVKHSLNMLECLDVGFPDRIGDDGL